MERQYLECLQFDINVSSSVYAKYYFELRYLAEAHDLILPIKLLDKERAMKLEVRLVQFVDVHLFSNPQPPHIYFVSVVLFM